MVRIVDVRLLADMPIFRKDPAAANKIFGSDFNALNGKTVSHKIPELQVEILSIPVAIMSLFCSFTVVSDITFVKITPFLISIILHLKFSTVECLENCRVTTLVKAIRTTNKTYVLRVFNLAVINIDPELEPLCSDIAASTILLKFCADNEHVPEVERFIRTVKVRCRGSYSALPSKRTPDIMAVAMVCVAVFWIHIFPALE